MQPKEKRLNKTYNGKKGFICNNIKIYVLNWHAQKVKGGIIVIIYKLKGYVHFTLKFVFVVFFWSKGLT